MPTAVVTPLADRFQQAIREAERRHDPEPILALFADDGTADSLLLPEPARGRDEVRRFWSAYLGIFREVRSEFTRAVDTGDGCVLEWVSRGILADGRPITYRGCSIVEGDDRVRSFRTYYDSAALLPRNGRR